MSIILRILKGFVIFVSQTLLLSAVFAKLSLIYNKTKDLIYEKWIWRGIDRESIMIDTVEEHYKKYGRKCEYCGCHVPKDEYPCPVCEDTPSKKQLKSMAVIEIPREHIQIEEDDATRSS